MKPEVLAYLRCPVCGAGLAPADRAVRCARGHTFDVARQGYLHLTTGPVRHPGDSAAMVAARADFLARGHYAFVAEALAQRAAELTVPGPAETTAGTRDRRAGGAAPAPLVVDVGAGTGYHLAAVLDALPAAVGLALDSSKAAARRAARAHPRADAVVCDAWSGLPVHDHAARLVLNVFAPRNPAEFRRVLAPGGELLVVTPQPEHLAELVGALDLLRVDVRKQERLAALGRPVLRRRLTRTLHLGHDDLRALVAMGPSARHVDPDAVSALPEPFTVTAAVQLDAYRFS
jgi:23S rRNA (guanine745-N1)-methyltransferase